MKATALSYGAATVIAAFATGRGSAFSVKLETKADVELIEGCGEVGVEIEGSPQENPELARACVRRVLSKFNRDLGAHVKTSSMIPVACGMKSSSAAANAVTLATVAALGESLEPMEVIQLGVDAAFDAKVTATGALDDATASFLGGLTLTDNANRTLLERREMPDKKILFLVPEGRSESGRVDVEGLRGKIGPRIEEAWTQLMRGNVNAALTLNGMLHSLAFNMDPSPAVEALVAGAEAAGLSGTGPATVAITSRDAVSGVKSAWRNFEGRVIETETNNTRAGVVE